MKIKDVDTENMSNDEINSLIKKLYQSKAQTPGGNGYTKVSIQTLSSADVSFNKNGKYYEKLNIPLMNNLIKGYYALFFQKNTTNRAEAMEWCRDYDYNYDKTINDGFTYHVYVKATEPKSSITSSHCKYINIFIMNYDEQ